MRIQWMHGGCENINNIHNKLTKFLPYYFFFFFFAGQLVSIHRETFIVCSGGSVGVKTGENYHEHINRQFSM